MLNASLIDLNETVNKGTFSKTYGGALTYGSMLNEFATHIDFSKINSRTKIIMANTMYNVLHYGANTITATCAAVDSQSGVENLFIYIYC